MGGRELKRFHKFGAVAAVTMLAVMVVPASLSAQNVRAEWTFMVYLDADNNLEPWGVSNLEWLEGVGSDENVNFVVLMDTYSGVADLLHVQMGESVSVGDEYGYPKEVNMGDPAVLEEFIEICCDDFSAKKYALILWDHGGGWRGLCWDDTSAEEGEDDFMSMVDLRDALVGAKDDTGVVFDVVGFDLCLMAMPEVAYQVRDCADYVVFSEETVPGAGFPYDTIAEDLVAEPTMDGMGLCSAIVEDYAELYTDVMVGYNDWTISAFDMAYMDELTDAVDDLGTQLLDGLRVYMSTIQKSLILAQEYYYPYNIDLKGFAMNLQADPVMEHEGIIQAAAVVEEIVGASVFAMINSDHNDASYGLAIYAPTTNEGMHSIKDTYIEVPFATETSWYEFTYTFSNWYGKAWSVV